MTYLFISKDPKIAMYIEEMAKWMESHSDCPPKKIHSLFVQEHEKIQSLFEPYPEIVFHEDPAKWAELLASSWGIIEEPELMFV